MKKFGEKGFGLVQIILLILLLILLGGAGYYVWSQNNQSDDDAATTTSTSVTSEPEASTEKDAETPPDPTSDWLTYTNEVGEFRFKHPSTWVFAENPELCNPGLVLFAANVDSVGRCASGSFGQMSASSQAGDIRAEYRLDPAYYPDVATEDVTVAGVSGVKQLGTYTPSGEDFGVDPATGDKILQYVFFDGERTYKVAYSIRATDPYPDVQSEFELLVNSTFELL